MGRKNAKTARGRGRPTVDATLVLVRLRPAELSALDKWIRAKGGDLTRPEALRELARNAAS
jgi:hypothetical protein